jgi:hypothetical protein
LKPHWENTHTHTPTILFYLKLLLFHNLKKKKLQWKKKIWVHILGVNTILQSTHVLTFHFEIKNSFIYLTNCATLDILVSLDIIIFHLAIMLKFFYMTFLDKELVSHCELRPCMSWFKTWIVISFRSILYTYLHLGHVIMHLSKSVKHQSNMKIVFQLSIINHDHNGQLRNLVTSYYLISKFNCVPFY